MTVSVSAEELTNAIVGELNKYNDKIAEGVQNAVDIVTDETAAEIKSRISFTQRTKKYVNAFATKTSFQDKRNKRNTWYVKDPQYRLTHLLENPHATRNGKRTRAFQHIKYGEELAKRRLPELIEKVIKGD